MKAGDFIKDNDLIPISLTTDFLMKAIFIKNKDIFGQMLNDVLKLNLKKIDMKIQNIELPIDKILEKRKNVDLFVIINDKYIIDTEVNKSRSKKVLERNIAYAYKIRSINIDKGTKLKDINKYQVYQLNLNVQGGKNEPLEMIGKCIDEESKKIMSINPIIITKNLEKYRELYYSGNREKDVVWIAVLTATRYSELEEILKNVIDEKRAQEIVKEVRDMCSKIRFPEKWWTREEEDKLVLEEAKQESYEEGMSQGISEGISQGEAKERKNLIENMFKCGATLDFVYDVTNVPIKQLEQIQTSLFL